MRFRVKSRPGDSEETIINKEQNRLRKIDGLKNEAGGAFELFKPAQTGEPASVEETKIFVSKIFDAMARPGTTQKEINQALDVLASKNIIKRTDIPKMLTQIMLQRRTIAGE